MAGCFEIMTWFTRFDLRKTKKDTIKFALKYPNLSIGIVSKTGLGCSYFMYLVLCRVVSILQVMGNCATLTFGFFCSCRKQRSLVVTTGSPKRCSPKIPTVDFGKIVFCKRIFAHVRDIPDDPVEHHLLYSQALHHNVVVSFK